jgi:hypothetical protein
MGVEGRVVGGFESCLRFENNGDLAFVTEL